MHLTLAQYAEWATIFAALSPLAWGVYRIYKWAERVDTAATNHIPHIYSILMLICDHLGIKYIDMEGNISETHPSSDRSGDRIDKGSK